MELLEVVDDNNNFIGKQEDRRIVHKEGLYHREVSVWIMNLKGELLLQKRASTKKQHPNEWATTAGHIDIGENPLQAAVREIYEEIGLKLKENNLEFLFLEKINASNNNHFKYIYYTKTDKKISEFVIQEEELSELKYISFEEFKNIIRTQNKEYAFSKSTYIPKLISILNNKEEIL